MPAFVSANAIAAAILMRHTRSRHAQVLERD